jgi:hypothetical protein
MKKSRLGFLNRKPQNAVRVTKPDGNRVWKSTVIKDKEWLTKADYFRDNEK